MNLGVVILPERDWPEAKPDWQRAEELGFDHAWTYDHVTFGGLPNATWHAAMPTLAAAALATKRIKLGTLVATPNLHHPVPLAQELLTLDRLSEGRLIAGIGAGGRGPDSRVLMRNSPTERERTERFEKFAKILGGLLRGEEVQSRGNFYEFDEVRIGVRPAQKVVPLLIASTGARGIRLAARYAAIWATSGPEGDPQTMDAATPALADQCRRLDAECIQLGRDPATMRRLLMTGTRIRGDLDSVEAFTDVCGRARDIGFTDLVVHWPRSEEPFRADVAVLEKVAIIDR